MNILVTGVKGFIGTNIVEYYLKHSDHDVIGIVNSISSPKDKYVISELKKHDRFDYRLCDLMNSVRLKSILDNEDVDVIINCASQSDVGKSFEQPYEFLRSNLEGVFNILEWLRYTKTGARLVQLSTEAVFGYGTKEKHKEYEALRPLNPYSSSKAAAEHYIDAYNFCFDIGAQVVRPVNNFGPYQNPAKLIAKTIINCIENTQFRLYKEENPDKRFWLYAEDTARAIDFVIKHKKPGTYNITPESGFTVHEAVEKISEIMGAEDLVLVERSETRRKDLEYYHMDGSKMKQLGWSPKYSFEEGIKKTIEWFRNNRFWYEDQLMVKT